MPKYKPAVAKELGPPMPVGVARCYHCGDFYWISMQSAIAVYSDGSCNHYWDTPFIPAWEQWWDID